MRTLLSLKTARKPNLTLIQDLKRIQNLSLSGRSLEVKTGKNEIC